MTETVIKDDYNYKVVVIKESWGSPQLKITDRTARRSMTLPLDAALVKRLVEASGFSVTPAAAPAPVATKKPMNFFMDKRAVIGMIQGFLKNDDYGIGTALNLSCTFSAPLPQEAFKASGLPAKGHQTWHQLRDNLQKVHDSSPSYPKDEGRAYLKQCIFAYIGEKF